jgi:hypothetical protein
MTHYTINYSELVEPAKHNKAIEDIKQWLGEERFEELTDMLRKDEELKINYARFSFLASFSGVQGYPAVAWHNHIFNLSPGTVED